MKLTETTATCTADVMRWIIANEHHRGYWTGPIESRTAFYLEGHSARIRIPTKIHRPGMMTGADYKATNRMYEPTEAGRRALEQSQSQEGK